MATDDNDTPFRARRVYVGTDSLIVELRGGYGQIIAPLEVIPELEQASEIERRTWRLLDGDRTIEWTKINLRVSLDDLPPPTLSR